MVNTLLNKMINVLNQNNISTYLISDTIVESIELFFIKKHLDMRRQKNVHHYTLTIYNDFEKDGQKMRGSSTIGIYYGMTNEELTEAITGAYFAASFVCNSYYELPSGKKEDFIQSDSSLSVDTLTDKANKMTEALFAEDNYNDTFINSAELFVDKTTSHLINSNGIDVSYETHTVKGEFVIQCITQQDVETYQDFYYDHVDVNALKEKVKQTLEMTKSRSIATKAPIAGDYTVILSGQNVKELFGYYLGRSSASMIYPKYSNYQVGTKVQGDHVIGDLLNITLKATKPYDSEGIAMKDRPLLIDGKLETIHGNSRFSHYLGIEPTGQYENILVSAGSEDFNSMKSGKYLHVVNFSDFQMDDFSGHFAGEIRLAFLSDGETVTPVTGGSINGNLLEAQKNLTFSKELQLEKGYEGPLAIRLENISVAGA